MQGGMFVPYDLRRICGRCCVCRRVAQVITMSGVKQLPHLFRRFEMLPCCPSMVFTLSAVFTPLVFTLSAWWIEVIPCNVAQGVI